MLQNESHIAVEFTKWYVCFLFFGFFCWVFFFFYYAKMENAQTFQRLVSEELYKQYLNSFFKVILSYFIVIIDFHF